MIAIGVAEPRAGRSAPRNGAAAPTATRDEADAATKQLLKASGLLESKLYKLAAQEYQDFLQTYPTHPDANNARYALAICEYQQKDYDKAVDLLDRVLKDPKFPQRDEALAVLGHSHQLAGRYDKALAAFDELLEKYAAEQAGGRGGAEQGAGALPGPEVPGRRGGRRVVPEEVQRQPRPSRGDVPAGAVGSAPKTRTIRPPVRCRS